MLNSTVKETIRQSPLPRPYKHDKIKGTNILNCSVVLMCSGLYRKRDVLNDNNQKEEHNILFELSNNRRHMGSEANISDQNI